MTKRERAQVVELLRCAADGVDRIAMPFTTAAEILGLRYMPAYSLAKDAFNATPFVDVTTDEWHRRFLEAAARVEEGSYP